MPGITKFDDLEIWQASRELVKSVYELTSEGRFARDFGLRDQLQRAAVSIMSNIAEGLERGGDREFRQFLFIAKASSAEVRSLLYVALDVGYINDDVHTRLSEQAAVLGRRIGGFIKYLDRTAK